jgi:light-regulated signal transduction histidine kinase (bacteriophytochrome)
VRDAPKPTTNDGTPRERELQRANDFHAVLLAMAGHDLRQPLQVIMNASRSWPKLRLRSSLEAMRWKFQADR